MVDKPLIKKKKPSGLGRGLSSLLGDIQAETPVAETTDTVADGGDNGGVTGAGLRMIAIADIKPNPDQPRQSFDEEALDELASSIRRRGVIQPVVVRPKGRDYQIVAGERRWRAAQKASLHQIPAIVRELDDEETLELAIVENVQRRDLNIVEEAEGYKRLAEDYDHSQAEIARMVGKSRSHVANIIRLTELDAAVQDMLRDGELEMGHARALINVPGAVKLARQAAKQGLSVRQVEKLAQLAKGEGGVPSAGKSRTKAAKDADIAAVEAHLGELLGLKVDIAPGKKPGAGSLTIDYSNLDQLDMLCQKLTGERI